MNNPDIIVVGGGAAGMMAAAKAVEAGARVLLIEKMERCGRKIRITGKGRCNITNLRKWEDFSKHIHPNPSFFKNSFFNFSNIELIEYLNRIGLKTVVERGERVFPESGRASDVADILTDHLINSGVEISLRSKLISVEVEKSRILAISYLKEGRQIQARCKALILTTGGLSYPLTGSDGEGHNIVSGIGHKISTCFPSLTALMPENYNRELKGLTVKNCTLSLFENGAPVQEEFGDIEFTNNGLEGPLGFRVSRRAVKAMINGNKISVKIDLKPALESHKLESRVRGELQSQKSGVRISEFLRGYIPLQMINSLCSYIGVEPHSKIDIDRDNIIKRVVEALKNWQIKIVSYTSYERAVVTAGGVSLKEISQKNLRSKIFDNLYFAGEIIDLDGDTGGYNLQIAFSTGALAGESAAQSILNEGN